MQISMSPKDYTIDFPDPKKSKYPAAIMRFRDHHGSEILLNMPKEQFEEFILRLNRRMDDE